MLPSLFGKPVVDKFWWATAGALLNNVSQNFLKTGKMVGVAGPLTCGLIAQDGTAYWIVAVGAGHATSTTVGRARAIADDARPLFGADWDRPKSGSILVARTRAAGLETYEEAEAWFKARLGEIASSRILETLLADGEITPPTADEPIEVAPSGFER
jgi:hypothetical protein